MDSLFFRFILVSFVSACLVGMVSCNSADSPTITHCYNSSQKKVYFFIPNPRTCFYVEELGVGGTVGKYAEPGFCRGLISVYTNKGNCVVPEKP